LPDIRLADISEFQSNIDAPAYLGGGYKCLIVRAHNGYRPDNKWPGRRDYLRGYDFTALGFYQYLVSDRDAATQAREFCSTVGPLRGNEFPILDLEVGSGSQTARANAWFDVVDAWAGFPGTLYSGESFGNSNLGGWSQWEGRPRWIAAYRSSEPTAPHELWQNTDHASFPGLSGGVDGNIFHGTDEQFLSTMRPGAEVLPLEDYMAIAACVADNGTMHVFVEASDGSVWYTYQPKGSTSWNGGKPGKQVAGLSKLAPAPGK